MNSKSIYKVISRVYDLLDITYFANYDRSPRKTVLQYINDREKVLDICTGTATNAIRIAKQKPSTKVIGIDLSNDMLKIAQLKMLVIFTYSYVRTKRIPRFHKKGFASIF